MLPQNIVQRICFIQKYFSHILLLVNSCSVLTLHSKFYLNCGLTDFNIRSLLTSTVTSVWFEHRLKLVAVSQCLHILFHRIALTLVIEITYSNLCYREIKSLSLGLVSPHCSLSLHLRLQHLHMGGASSCLGCSTSNPVSYSWTGKAAQNGPSISALTPRRDPKEIPVFWLWTNLALAGTAIWRVK